MMKFVAGLLAIFEFIFYTLLMVLVNSIEIKVKFLKVLEHFGALVGISLILYFLFRFILGKLQVNVRRYLYLVVVLNLVIGLLGPAVILIILPNEFLFGLGMIMMVGTLYYGLIVNLIICMLNLFLTNS